MEKTILAILVVVVVLGVVGGAYFYLSQRQAQPSTPPQQNTQQGQQGGESQQGQQGQQQTSSGSQGSQGQQGQQGQSGQQEQQQGQQEYTFDQFLSGVIGKAFKATGVFSGTSTSEGKTTTARGRFTMASKDGKYKFYMEVEESNEEGAKGANAIFSFQNDTGHATYIICTKNAQTQDKWVCIRATQHVSGSGQQSGVGAGQMGGQAVSENPADTWEDYRNSFSYEGLKEIHGVMLHCFYAKIQENESTIEERVCFDPQLNFYRYYWEKSIYPDGSSEWELFIDSVSFSVGDEEFTPPAKPMSIPNVPNVPSGP